MYDTVIWATDGSDGADGALTEALRLAGETGRIHAVHADERLRGRAAGMPALADEDDLRAKIAGRVDELKARGVAIELDVRRTQDRAADAVAHAATELAADVIVCGTRGLGALSGALLGSFTHALLHVAPCPVLVVGPRSGLAAAARRAG